MISKVLEIRDRGTFIPAIAIRLSPKDDSERYLLAEAGYGVDPHVQGEYVLLIRIYGGSGFSTSDLLEWPGSARTMQVAHDFINKTFDKLESGDVIDVQYILGETADKKRSQRYEGLYEDKQK